MTLASITLTRLLAKCLQVYPKQRSSIRPLSMAGWLYSIVAAVNVAVGEHSHRRADFCQSEFLTI